MTFKFTPANNGDRTIDTPFIEDARAATAPYYRSTAITEAGRVMLEGEVQ